MSLKIRVTKAHVCVKCEGVFLEKNILMSPEAVQALIDEKNPNFYPYVDKHNKTDYRQIVPARHTYC